ncbi:unnamed protein product [Schistosoma mattheei]|uniref:Uncharacterized protein n=1 Tax=Schistosoma mattheei TaxID=31246 RepID=A0A183Q676_9TREM|nr:unnamed protein product [Schistosoma mattheei]
MERIELLSNWSIPYCDYAAPLKCSVEDFTDQKQDSYQSSLDTNYGLVNLNKWIKRLFPYLLDCVIIWCKAEKCWKYDIMMSGNCSTQVLISKLQALCRITLSSANIVPEYQCHSELQ